MSKIVAKQLVEMLTSAKVRRVYTITGDSLNHFNVAIRKKGKERTNTVRRQIQYLRLLG